MVVVRVVRVRREVVVVVGEGVVRARGARRLAARRAPEADADADGRRRLRRPAAGALRGDGRERGAGRGARGPGGTHVSALGRRRPRGRHAALGALQRIGVTA